MKVLYNFKTTFASIEIKFLTIQPIISFAFNTAEVEFKLAYCDVTVEQLCHEDSPTNFNYWYFIDEFLLGFFYLFIYLFFFLIYKVLNWFDLVGWVLWHINLCRLFNAKSIFMDLFKTIQFSMSTQFNCEKLFYFKLFSLFKQLYITIQFSVSTVSMSKTVQFQKIQFNISTQFKCKYSLIVKNISISSYSV